jgi:hypothetical protein
MTATIAAQRIHSYLPSAARSSPPHLRAVGEHVLICALLLVHFIANIYSTSFYPDESQWIATSSALETFVSGDVAAWQENYWTLTQPPVARYVIGVGRRAGGWGPADLNMPWNYFTDLLTNIHEGAMPSVDLLWYSRLPMAIFAALSGTVMVFLLTQLAGRLAGYAWLLFFMSSRYVDETLLRAMGESPLLLAVTMVLVVSWAVFATLFRAPTRSDTRRIGLLLLVGAIASGVAGATKLNGLTIVLLPMCAGAWSAARRARAPRVSAVLAPVLVGSVAFLTFVALNPYLYPAPLTRTARMIDHRFSEMEQQRYTYAEAAMPDGLGRVSRIGTRVFRDYLPLNLDRAGVVNALLASAGIVFALRLVADRCGSPSSIAAAIALLAAVAVGTPPMLLSELDWDRYYLLPIILAMAFSAVGFAVTMRWAADTVAATATMVTRWNRVSSR